MAGAPERPRHPRSAGFRRGFSIMELVTALAIGMILTVIGLASLQIFQTEDQLDSAAVRLSNALSSARTLAVSQNAFYQVALDIDNGNFWIDEIEDPEVDPGADPLTPKVVHPEKLGDLVLVDGVLFSGAGSPETSGIQEFIFSPDGSADNDAIITFVLKGKDATVDTNIYSVRIYAATGSNLISERDRATF